jgi:division protein CdvB (Snf7/Vps24/ESCRT-III family)
LVDQDRQFHSARKQQAPQVSGHNNSRFAQEEFVEMQATVNLMSKKIEKLEQLVKVRMPSGNFLYFQIKDQKIDILTSKLEASVMKIQQLQQQLQDSSSSSNIMQQPSRSTGTNNRRG